MSRLPIGWRGASSISLAGLLIASPASAAPDPALAQTLQAQTQAMVDAVGRGDKAVWDAALDPSVILVTEDNRVLTKAQLLAGLAPLPPGLTGQIRVANYTLNHDGNVAVATYVNDESLDFNGQFVRTRYRVTDTWTLKGKDWKLIASQANAVLDDPKPAELPAAMLDQYKGQYELTFDIHMRVDVVNGRLVGQRQGDPKIVEWKPEAADVFFLSGSPRTRKIFQRNESGAVTGYVDRREGHDVVWKKVQ